MRPDPLFLLSGIGMILVAAGSVLFWRLRRRSPMSPFLLGAAAWVVSVGLKAGFAIACNRAVQGALDRQLGPAVAGPLFWLYVGLLTGVFECGFVLLLTRWPRIGAYDFDRATAFGVGFGAVEALLLGLAGLGGVIAAMAAPDKMPKALMDGFALGHGVILAPILERLCAVVLHAFACALIILGARRRRWAFFWAAFAYKSLVDAVAAWSQLSFKIDTAAHLWIVEAIGFAFAIAGVVGRVRLSRGGADGGAA